MSSFFGHSLVGLTTYSITQQLQLDRYNESKQPSWKFLLWLLAIASIPDIDYLIPGLRIQQATQTLRITHSFLGVLVVPSFTMLGLWLLGKRGKSYKLKSLQVVLVALSHLLLDLLTGVFPLPLLYPFSKQLFRLPFGLLPSAGRIQLNNYLLYRNLLIELGVLIPLSISLLLSIRGSAKSLKDLSIVVFGLVVSVCFMIWAFTLDR
jgi:inner membrane protein